MGLWQTLVGASAPDDSNQKEKENQQPVPRPPAPAAVSTTASGLPLAPFEEQSFENGEEVLYTSKSGIPSQFILESARVVSAHHDDPNGPYYVIVIPSKPIEKRDVNTVHNKLVRMTDVPPHRAHTIIHKGDLIWYKPSNDTNWIGAQVMQGIVKSTQNSSFSISVAGGNAITTDLSHMILCQTWPHFRVDQRCIYCPDPKKNPSAWTYAQLKAVNVVGSNQYSYAIQFGGDHQRAVWKSKLEKTGKTPLLHPEWKTIFSEAGLGTVETCEAAEQIAWNWCRIFVPEHVSHMSFWHQMESKTYMYEQLENLAGPINFRKHELDCVAGVWRKKNKPIPVLDFSQVPDDGMVATANKAILAVLTSTDKSLKKRKIFAELLAKGLDNQWQTKNATILWKLLGPFLLSPKEFLATAQAHKDVPIAGHLPPANGADDDDEEGFRGGKTNGDDDDDDDDDQQPGAGAALQVAAGARRPFDSPDTISSAESVDFDKLSVDQQRKLFKKKSNTAKKAQRQLTIAQESLQNVSGSLRDVTGSNRNMSITIRSQQDLQATMVVDRQEADQRREQDRQEADQRREQDRQEADQRREEDRLRFEAQVQADRERSEANMQAERERHAAMIREERRFVVESLAPLLAPAPIVDAPAVAGDAAEDKTDSKASASGDAANTTSTGALPKVAGTSGAASARTRSTATASARTRSTATPVAKHLNTPARAQFSSAPMAPVTILHDTVSATGASDGGTETGDAVAQGTGSAPPLVQEASPEEAGVDQPQQDEQQPQLVVTDLNDERNAWVVSDDQAISEGDYVVWTPEDPNVAVLQNNRFLGPFRVVGLRGRTLTAQNQRLSYEVPGRDKPQIRSKGKVTKVVRRGDHN